MMGYNDANWGAAEWLAMGLMMLLLWGLLAGLVVWAVRTLRPGGESSRPHGTNGRADEILSERYARGDIDDAEFEQRRALLHSS